MTTPTAAARLRAALESTAGALIGHDLEALLIGESALTAALAALPSMRSLPAAERASAIADLQQARVMLRRCERLGAALGEMVRVTVETGGQGVGYQPIGGAAATLSGRQLETRA